MARRRKKAKGGSSSRPAPSTGQGSAPSVEKALPSLPPGAAASSVGTPQHETPPSDFPSDRGARSPRQQHSRLKSARDPSSSDNQRDVSPLSDDARRGR